METFSFPWRHFLSHLTLRSAVLGSLLLGRPGANLQKKLPMAGPPPAETCKDGGKNMGEKGRVEARVEGLANPILQAALQPWQEGMTSRDRRQALREGVHMVVLLITSFYPTNPVILPRTGPEPAQCRGQHSLQLHPLSPRF